MWHTATHPCVFMVVFNVDLDNTLIYSYKHDIGDDKRCVELYQGREISFMTDRTWQLLKELKKRLMVVPTTTRTAEQYRRIKLGLGDFPYALVCNGGILLTDGASDEKWHQESLSLISASMGELTRAERLLEKDSNRCFEVRNINELFLFTKSSCPEESVKRLEEELDSSLVDVFRNGIKVYVVPKQLNKGRAVSRLRKRLEPEMVVAAGDSEFDRSMLECADIALAPQGLKLSGAAWQKVKRINENMLFSEGLLEEIETIFQ